MQAEAAKVYEGYNAEYIDAPFYTNHDLARSAGYYAGDNSTAQTKMGHALNLLMSGNVFLYYGEELGMKGSGKDENKRAPMYWSTTAAAEGMCDGPADMDSIKMKFDSLEEQSEDSASIYNYVKDVIRLRNQNPEIARGTVTCIEKVSNEQICVLEKEYQGKITVLIFNISATEATVDLSAVRFGETNAAAKSDSAEISPQGLEVIGELLTGDAPITREGSSVTMPAYSILVLGNQM